MNHQAMTPFKSSFQSAVLPVLGRLRTSATFAMSLGSKELFHTNFLAFLLESQDTALSPLQEGLRALFGCPRSAGEESWCFVFRELHKLDLVVVPVKKRAVNDKVDGLDDAEMDYEPSGSPCAVIEAKVKALPTVEQLQDYNKLLRRSAKYTWEDSAGKRNGAVICSVMADGRPHASLRLLTVDGQSLTDPERDKWHWEPVDWKHVADQIDAYVSSPAAAQLGARVREVIADYGDSLCQVISIVSLTRKHYRDSGARSYERFLHDILRFPELKASRLVDLVGKRAYAEWLADIRIAIGAESVSAGRLNGEAFLTRGTPGLLVEWHFRTNGTPKDAALRIGVQVQGHSYRHFFAVNPKWSGLEQFAARDFPFDEWFCGPIATLPGAPELMATVPGKKKAERPALYPRGTRPTNLRVFGETTFLYSAADLNNPAVKLGNVTDAIVASMRLAEALVARLKG